MCGIFGIILTKKTSTNVIEKAVKTLFRLSESRGKEASGVVLSMGSHTHVLKMPIKSTQFIHTPEFKSLFKNIENLSIDDYPFAIIGHSRLTTNGKESDNQNNQPLTTKSAAIVHNGIVLNTPDIWKKYRNLKKHTEVDTEIILALYDNYRKQNANPDVAMYKVFKEIQGAASIAILETRFPFLVLASNTGSLYYFSGDGCFVFASEEYILNRFVSFSRNLRAHQKVPIIHCNAGGGLVINIISLTKRQFNVFTKPLLHTDSSVSFNIRPILYHTIVSTPITRSFPINSIIKLKTHKPNYNKIYCIKRCSKCIMPETMPLISFDKNGVCNFCKSYEKAKPEGKELLESFISPFRSKNGSPDCIVALSGGRDSSYGLHYAKTVLHLNPIAYTYDWGVITDVARRNQSRITAALGVEHIIVSADIQKKRDNIRKNIEAWLKKPDLGMVTLLMAGDKQAEFYAEELKRKTGIKLILYCRGNQLEDERFKFGYYGILNGTPWGVLHDLSIGGQIKMLSYYASRFIQNPKYLNSSLIDTAWGYASAYLIKHDFFYLWHYLPWNEKEIVSTLKETYGWETPSDTIASWRIDDGTPPFYNYIYYHVQGFTEHDGLRSNQIRERVISRKRAIELVNEENKPRYNSLQWYFNTIGIDGNRVLSIVDSISTLY